MRSPFLSRLLALAEGELGTRPAILDDHGARSFSALLLGALRAREAVCRGNTSGEASLAGQRVAILLSPGASWVEAFAGVLFAGGVAVPLSPLYPAAELAWFAADAGAGTVIVGEEHDDRAGPLMEGRRVLRPADLRAPDPGVPAEVEAQDTALLLYTSGTTGKPKGAMITHENVVVQASLLHEAWGFGDKDRLLHALPLHHLHGLGISLLTSLLAGASSRMLPRFDATRVWEEMAAGGITVWMAVPTMYQKLVDAFDAADTSTQARWAAGARSLRLATSGSAALPVTLAARWKEIAGEVPLERFGMTEIGVGMSNPLDPAARRPGSVGPALRTVESRIVDDHGDDLEAGPGELLIRGPSVFKGYFRREEATRAAFVDGWFKTGDVAERAPDGFVRLLGRTSVDILKTGGYKLSALEIEEVLRDNAAIAEVAVVGVPDETWGDRVVAVIVPQPGREASCTEEALRAWAKERLATYKVPRQVVVTRALPRNALGKVTKPDLVKALAAGEIG
jgi:malonyl-CoA/methylmalonyl-CoA synthetase